MIEETHTFLAWFPYSQETVGYSAGHDVTLGTWQSAPNQALFYRLWWHPLYILGKIRTCGNWGKNGKHIYVLFFQILFDFLSVCFKENSISSWAYLALLVFYCLSVWLTGHRSDYIWKVLFYFFPCRILGKVWCWSWLSCPRLSAFFFFLFCSFSSKSQGYDELQGQMGCFGSNSLFRISRLSFKNESYFFSPCSILDVEFGKKKKPSLEDEFHYFIGGVPWLSQYECYNWSGIK